MNSRLLFVTFATALVGLGAMPNAAAQDLPDLPFDVAVQPALLECGSFVANHDGGEDSDVWNYCATPQCGCMCPYVGAGVVVEAAGQERGAFVLASCQSGYGTTQGPADGGAPVTVFPLVGGGGLDLTFE